MSGFVYRYGILLNSVFIHISWFSFPFRVPEIEQGIVTACLSKTGDDGNDIEIEKN
jgi:hypothetical protein